MVLASKSHATVFVYLRSTRYLSRTNVRLTPLQSLSYPLIIPQLTPLQSLSYSPTFVRLTPLQSHFYPLTNVQLTPLQSLSYSLTIVRPIFESTILDPYK